MTRRQRRIGTNLVVKALSAVFRASHTVPAVGFFIAAALGIIWWRLRGSESALAQWAALGVILLAGFFGVVALIGFALIVLERLANKSRRG